MSGLLGREPSGEPEGIVRHTPFGVRFWDVAAGSAMSDGLTVSARRADAPHRASVRSVLTPSGVHAFPRLSRAVAHRHEASEPGTGPFEEIRVDVADPRRRRVLPTTFLASAAVGGLSAPVCDELGSVITDWNSGWYQASQSASFSWPMTEAEPPWPMPKPGGSASAPEPWLPVVPLFPAPERSLPAGRAVIRADLRLVRPGTGTPTGEPAAWSVVVAGPVGSPPGVGVADEQGRVAVIMPWPEPTVPSAVGGATSRPLSGESWDIEVRVFFADLNPYPEFAGDAAPGARPSKPPDLCDLLTQSPVTPLLPPDGAVLRFGKQLVLASEGHSALLVDPLV
ncbi:hypothetical protein [Streptomyces sp. NPDC059916]|uniref:hypothetical protein n=1 Tax=Streptomyces sp. NPDC059916 TaxID=3347001 RepID=UPI0036C29AED